MAGYFCRGRVHAQILSWQRCLQTVRKLDIQTLRFFLERQRYRYGRGCSIQRTWPLQDITRQVLIFDEFAKMLVNIVRVDTIRIAGTI